IEPELDGRRDLVDVLAARTGRANKPLVEVVLVNRYRVRDADHEMGTGLFSAKWGRGYFRGGCSDCCDDEAGPAAQKRQPAKRGDRARDGAAPRQQRVQTAGEQPGAGGAE